MINLPEQFLNQAASFFPTEEETNCFIRAITSSDPPASVRLNPYKRVDLFPNTELVSWCPDGRYLSSRPSYTMDPMFWGGAYYPQEASSMVIGEIVRRLNPSKVLDLCAAPGGKTTHIASVISKDSLLVSNEVISNRARTLVENVQRWGSGNVVVTSSQPRAFSRLCGYFDLLVADVPCSGEGMFRKDPASISQWSSDAPSMCAARSRSILEDAWNSLATGGYILFSTCTYNHQEDEQIVEYIAQKLGAEYISLTGIVPSDAVTNGAGYHFYPHKLSGEGFFVALLKKVSDVEFIPSRSAEPLKKVSSAVMQSYFTDSMEFRMAAENCYALPPVVASEIDQIRSAVSPIYSGVSVGRVIADKLKPSHALALYHGTVRHSVSELSLSDALHYLRRDSQSAELFASGLSMVCYNGISLGWANRVQGRVNNLYPSNLRILQQISE